MKRVFIINGAMPFGHASGKFNETVFNTTINYFKSQKDVEVKTTWVGNAYDPMEEGEKFKWADLVVYHTPVWWFNLPFYFKKYIDEVLTAGHESGLYASDGRSHNNPEINYGTGGLLQGTNYILTTSWNAPKTAFTLENEFFDQKSVDEGPFYPFHKMNAFIGMKFLASHHFYDVEKNADIPFELENYRLFLANLPGNS